MEFKLHCNKILFLSQSCPNLHPLLNLYPLIPLCKFLLQHSQIRQLLQMFPCTLSKLLRARQSCRPWRVSEPNYTHLLNQGILPLQFLEVQCRVSPQMYHRNQSLCCLCRQPLVYPSGLMGQFRVQCLSHCIPLTHSLSALQQLV